MSLNVSKLEKVRELAGGIVQARCPACAEGGNDRAGEHLRIYPDGRFGCCVHPKSGEHRKRIFALAGDKSPRQFTAKVASTKTAGPELRSVSAALTGFRTLRTPKTESDPTESKASQVSPAADSDGVYLQSEYFRTLRTPLSNPRAYARENMYMCKDLESGVLPVLAVLPAKRLPFLTPGGDLSIPFDSPERYHWWKLDGNRQSVAETLNEVRERMNCADDF
jgi:hypothetical protein